MDRIIRILCGDAEENISIVIQDILKAYSNETDLRYSTLTDVFYTYLSDANVGSVKDKMALIDYSISVLLISHEYKGLLKEERIIVEKFCDHLLLEVKRKQEYLLQNEIFENKVQEVNKRLEEKQQELKEHLATEASKQQKFLETDLNVKSQQLEQSLSTNIITVLGIFAAFITAFMGGIGAFGSIMQSINQTNVFRFVFTLFLFGMIYFDTCYVLIFSVSKMLNKPICTSSSQGSKNIFKKYPIFCWFNVFMIVGMMLTIIWFYVSR